MKHWDREKYLVNLITILVEKLGGRAEITDLELLDQGGKELQSYEDRATKSIILQVRDPNPLRRAAPTQRTTHGGVCVATPLSPLEYGGDQPDYEIVEDHLPQLPQLADPTQDASRSKQRDQPST